MHAMNEAHVSDLLVLDVLLDTRSVSAAARRLGVTQSAMSHTLARLRERLGDPLLVRSGRALVPTARAEAMRGPLRAARAALDAAVASPARFEPAHARRAFTLTMPDYGELVLLPALLARLEQDAPGVDLRIVRAATAATSLADGSDLVVQPLRAEDEVAGLRARVLFRERFVCVARRGNPLFDGELSPERFAAARHLLIAPRGTLGGVVDDVLRARGQERRTVVATPSFVAAAWLVASTDLVVTFPERVAHRVAAGLPLEVREHPLVLPGFGTSMIWHERDDLDEGHTWLRGLVAEVAAGL